MSSRFAFTPLLLLAACATTRPTRVPTAPVHAEPPMEVERAWIPNGAWITLGPADQVLPGLARTGALELDQASQFTVHGPVDEARLPPEVSALKALTLWAVAEGGEACRVEVGRVVVGAHLGGDDHAYIELVEGMEYDEQGEIVREIPEQERWSKALARVPLQAMVELTTPDGKRFEGCDESSQVHHITTIPGKSLIGADAPADLLERGLAAFRAHGFWEVQQAAYQRSVEALRERTRREYEAEVKALKKRRASREEIAELERDTRADEAPPTWDKPANDDEYAQPEGTVWTEEGGRPRFLKVELGHDLSCAAPRAWMLFELSGEALTPLDFGVALAPRGVIARPEGFEVLGGWPGILWRVVGDHLESIAQSSIDFGLHCSWEQIPPVTGEPGK